MFAVSKIFLIFAQNMKSYEVIEWANDPFIIKCIETRNNLLASAIPTYSADFNSMEFRIEYSSEVREAIENINKSIVEHITKRYPKHRSGIEELKRYEAYWANNVIQEQNK